MKRLLFLLSLSAVTFLHGVTVRSSSMELNLSENRHGAVDSIVTAAGTAIGPSQGSTNLFSLTFQRPEDFTKRLEIWSSQAKSFTVTKTQDGCVLLFSEFPDGAENVTCTVKGNATDPCVRWQITVTPKNGWALTETAYPRILFAKNIGKSGEDDCIVTGHAWGGVIHNPISPELKPWLVRSKQPGYLVAQFGTFYDNAAGAYFAAEDGKGHVKQLEVDREEHGIRFLWRRYSFATGLETTDFDAVTAAFDGTPNRPVLWYDAADLYKQWAVQQRWCKTLLKDRQDIPLWLRSGAALTLFTRQWFTQPDSIIKWTDSFWKKNFPNIHLVAAMWGWEKYGNWVSDYFPCFPSDDIFKNIVKELHNRDIHAYPWPSGYNWTQTFIKKPDGTFVHDFRDDFNKRAAAHACVNVNGSIHSRTIDTPDWLAGGSLTTMCGGDSWTQNWWNNDVSAPLAERGCAMIQVDQNNGGAFPPCWSRTHGHLPGEGIWKTDAARQQLISMKETIRKICGEAVVTCEEPNEQLNDLIGIQFFRDTRPKTTWAGVLNYLYHEYIPIFQPNPARGNEAYTWMAYAVTEGQMPRIVPLFADSNAGGPALTDGGFEQLMPDGNAFAQWEKPFLHFVSKDIKHSGSSSLKIQPQDGQRIQIARNVYTSDSVFIPGRRFRLSAWLKTERPGTRLSVDFGIYNSKLESLASNVLKFPAPDAGWQLVSADIVMTDKPSIMLRIMINADGDALGWIDDMKLETVAGDGSPSITTLQGDVTYVNYMQKWMNLYHGEARQFLLYGKRCRPPQLSCATTERNGRQEPLVFHSMFRSDDNKLALVLANSSFARQPVTATWPDGHSQSYVLAPLDIKIVPVTP